MKKSIIFFAIVLFTTTLVYSEEIENTASDETKEEVVSESMDASEEASEEVKEEAVKEAAEAVKEAPKGEKKSSNQFIADLSSDDEAKITNAAIWLGNEKEKSAVTKLTELLKSDSRVKVRLYSAIALGLIGDPGAIDTLNYAVLNDQSADVRYTVLLAIHRIDPGKSVDTLKKVNESEVDPYIRDYIDKMLAKIKGE